MPRRVVRGQATDGPGARLMVTAEGCAEQPAWKSALAPIFTQRIGPRSSPSVCDSPCCCIPLLATDPTPADLLAPRGAVADCLEVTATVMARALTSSSPDTADAMGSSRGESGMHDVAHDPRAGSEIAPTFRSSRWPAGLPAKGLTIAWQPALG